MTTTVHTEQPRRMPSPRLARVGGRVAAIAAAAIALLAISSNGTYWTTVLDVALINVLLVASLNLMFGFAGQLSLAHAAMAGVGAYVCANLAAKSGLAFPLPLIGAGIGGACAGVLLLPLTRLAVLYFSMASLALGLILLTLFSNLSGLTGGHNGMAAPPLTLPGGSIAWGLPDKLLWVIFAVVLLQLLMIHRITHGRSGRNFRALRDNTLAARTLGVPVIGARAEAVVIGCFWAGIAGGFQAYLNQFVAPDSFGMLPSVMLILPVVLGGLGRTWGVVTAALGISFLNEFLGKWPSASPIVYGALIIVVMMAFKDGLAGGLALAWRFLRRRLGRAGMHGDAASTALAAAAREHLEAPTIPTDAAAPDGPLLECIELSRSFGGVHAVNDVSFSVGRAEIHGLIGPNGAGKSTVLNLMAGADVPSGGRVAIAGHAIRGRAPERCARRGLVRTFQHGALFESMTVAENVLTAVGPHPGVAALRSLLPARLGGLDEDQALARARWSVEVVGIGELGDRRVGDLSYGERRLVELARALAAGPRVLLLDEPAAGLTPAERQRLTDVLERLRDAFGVTILIVEHDLALIRQLCDRITVLDSGRVLVTGEPEAVMQQAAVREAYLGRA